MEAGPRPRPQPPAPVRNRRFGGGWLASTIVLCALPFPALADIVWPALVAEGRIFTWWAIGLGLLVELGFIRKVFALPYRRTLLVTVVANAVSSVAGLVLIPLAGIAWVPLGMLLHFESVFGPAMWIATFATAALINAGIEAAVYRNGFRLPLRRREFLWVLAANAVSTGIAFGSMLVFPPHIW